MPSKNAIPQLRFRGWRTYREWAEHGFIEKPAGNPSGSGPQRTRPPSPAPAARRDTEAALAYHRDIANQINARERGWFVLFGPATRLFWAFPQWQAPPGLILSAADPTDLLRQIRQAEATHHRHPMKLSFSSTLTSEGTSTPAAEATPGEKGAETAATFCDHGPRPCPPVPPR
jgi:hypothetical protein